MAGAGLTGRLARAEARLDDVAIRYMARRAAAEGAAKGVAASVAEYEAELRAVFRQMVARLGPDPTPRAIAAFIAERYGTDAAGAYADLKAARAAGVRGGKR